MTVLPDDLPISQRDISLAGHCARRRAWFVEHGLEAEFVELVKGGTMPSGKLLATGDPRAVQVVARKVERERSDG